MATTADTLTARAELYIGGEWTAPSGSDTIDVINASTEEVMGHIPRGTPEDVDKAVAAARAAFDSWSQTDPVDRAELCAATAAKLQERAEEIATLIAQELGMPIGLSTAIQA